MRGFCDHTNFAVVGMAVPPRVNLFRAQASRAIGGNGRRTSHNPPDRHMLDIYDRVGVVEPAVPGVGLRSCQCFSMRRDGVDAAR